MTTKKCKKCGTEKTLDNFYWRTDSNCYRRECKTCYVDRVLKRTHGIGNIEYKVMHDSQNGVCDICKCKLNSSRFTKFAVDHDHKTGKIRGLLCTNCNTALGLFKDSTTRLSSAIHYLKKNGCEDIV